MFSTLPPYQVRRCSQQHDDRADNHRHANHLINDADAVGVELHTYLIHQPRQAPPPKQRAAHNAGKANEHLKRMVGQHEGKLRIHGQEEEDNQRIRERDQKGRPRVIPQRALLLPRLVHLLRGVGTVGIESESQQHQTTHYLQVEAVLVVIDQVHDERHTETRKSCIEDIADSGSNARSKAIPAPFVQRALHTKDTHRPHWRRCYHPNEHALEDEVQDVDWHVKWHCECKGTKK